MDRALLMAPPGVSIGVSALNRLVALNTAAAVCLIDGDAAAAATLLPAASCASAREAAVFFLRTAQRHPTTAKQLKSALEVHTDLAPAAVDAILGACTVCLRRLHGVRGHAVCAHFQFFFALVCFIFLFSLLPNMQRAAVSVAASGEVAALPSAISAGMLPASLDELSWTLGVATHATGAASLNQPFVVLDLKLRTFDTPTAASAAADGATAATTPQLPPATHEKVELTLAQLAALETTLRDALAAMQ